MPRLHSNISAYKSSRAKLSLGRCTIQVGPVKAAHIFSESKQVANYWRVKASKVTRPFSWGGARNYRFTLRVEALIRVLIKNLIEKNVIISLDYIKNKILKICLNKWWISVLLKSWGLTFKKPEVRNINKFSSENIHYWMFFTTWVLNKNVLKLKYLDEVHFEPKSLRLQRGLSPRGSKIVWTNREHLSERYSSILITIPAGNPSIFVPTQHSFLDFIFQSIRDGALCNGDILLMDNSSIHFAKDIHNTLMAMLTSQNIRLEFLPQYSPELNPCELVFAKVKHIVRNIRSENNFLPDVEAAMSTVTTSDIFNFYIIDCKLEY